MLCVGLRLGLGLGVRGAVPLRPILGTLRYSVNGSWVLGSAALHTLYISAGNPCGRTEDGEGKQSGLVLGEILSP